MARSEKRTLSIEARMQDFLSRPLSTAERRVLRFADRSAAGLRRLTSGIFSMRTAVLGLVGAFGAYQAISFVRETAQQTDALGKFALGVGDAIENLSELDAAFKLAGASSEKFRTATSALYSAARGALSGSEDQVRTFRELGIEVSELARLGPSQIFERLSVGLERFGSQQEKALLLSRLFPETFRDLLPLIGQGAQAFQDSIRDVRAAGATVTAAEAAASAQLNDGLLRVELAFQNVGRGLIQSFGPTTAALMNNFAKVVVENRDAIIGFAKVVAGSFVRALDIGSNAIIQFIGLIDSLPGVDLVDQTKLEEQRRSIVSALDQIRQAQDPDGAERAARAFAKVFAQRSGNPFSGQTDNQQDLDRYLTDLRSRRQEVLDSLLPQKAELEARLAEIDRTLSGGIEAQLQAIKADFTAAIGGAAATIEQSLRDATASTGASAGQSPLIPSSEQVEQFRQDFTSVFKEAQRQAGDVVTKGLDQRIESGRLQLLRQLAALAPEIRPIQDAIAEIDRQSFVLSLQQAADQGVINAQELAAAVGFVNQQFAQSRSLIAGGNFFGGFAEGARDAVRGWTDFTAAGKEAATTLIDGGLTGLTDAFASLIDGTKNAKDAFKDFARQMLSDLARIIAKLLIQRALTAALGVPAFARGGVFPAPVESTLPLRTYARGGVASSPQLAVFGEGRQAEAFVPLPDGRSIPVSFVGGGGGSGRTVNITIQAMDSKDVQRALAENAETLRGLWTSDLEHRTSMRQAVQRTVT